MRNQPHSTMADEDDAVMDQPERFVRADEEQATGEPPTLLDRLERQAESIGTLKGRIEALETALRRERASRDKAKKLLAEERERQTRAEERAALLEQRVNSIHDANQELARERQTVSALQGELKRAWSEVNALQAELGTKRRGLRKRSY
jgi:chromosome segregation ATPase